MPYLCNKCGSCSYGINVSKVLGFVWLNKQPFLSYLILVHLAMVGAPIWVVLIARAEQVSRVTRLCLLESTDNFMFSLYNHRVTFTDLFSWLVYYNLSQCGFALPISAEMFQNQCEKSIWISIQLIYCVNPSTYILSPFLLSPQALQLVAHCNIIKVSLASFNFEYFIYSIQPSHSTFQSFLNFKSLLFSNFTQIAYLFFIILPNHKEIGNVFTGHVVPSLDLFLKVWNMPYFHLWEWYV